MSEHFIPEHDAPSLSIQLEDGFLPEARIRAIGVGGGGGNALSRMLASRMPGVEATYANTDLQALSRCAYAEKLQLGEQVTRGLGAGADPQLGRRAALEDTPRIMAALAGLDAVFVLVGLGGGTGTGAAPVIAALAREMGSLSIAIATLPFGFEGRRRLQNAEMGLEELYGAADAVVVIRNDRLLEAHGPQLSLTEAFQQVDQLMADAVRSVTDLVSDNGLINLDFADVRTTMSEMGSAVMGTGRASGEERAGKAAWAAINSPLLNNAGIDGARNVIVSIAGGTDLTLHEVSEAASVIHDQVDPNAAIIFGSTIDESLNDSIRVTVIANGHPYVAELAQSGEAETPVREAQPFDERLAHEPAYLRRRKLG